MEWIKAGHGFHVWNSLSNDKAVDTNENSTQVYALLAKENCPLTWTLRNQFPIN
jgi:hypothetical protein